MEKNRIISILTFVGISLLFFCSCSIEKRIYRKGYHIVWSHKKNNEPKRAELARQTHEVKPGLIVSNEADPELLPVKKMPLLVLDADTCGDKLLLQNADELTVKITEIDDSFIKYKRCDNLSGPTYSIAKNKVALITYANGVKEVIMNEPPSKKMQPVTQAPQMNPDQTQVPKKTNPLGLASLLIYIGGTILLKNVVLTNLTGSMYLLLFLLSILPLIMAYVSLFQFKREPDRYKGRWMPITVVCIYLASLLIVMLILATLSTLGSTSVGPFMAIFLLIFLVLLGVLIAALIPKATMPPSGR